MRTLIQDLRYGIRMLARNRGFTTVAAFTLALGIGANTAMFSMVYGVLMRPLPFKDPGQLYTLWERNLKMGYEQNAPAAANFADWRDRSKVFEQMAAFDASRTFNLAGSGNPERVDGAAVSPSLFELLGAEPVLGRTFSSALATPLQRRPLDCAQVHHDRRQELHGDRSDAAELPVSGRHWDDLKHLHGPARSIVGPAGAAAGRLACALRTLPASDRPPASWSYTGPRSGGNEFH